MTIIEACILGIIQGITEFFPVSSSGHLKLAQHFLGLKDLDQYILFDLVCHLGTLLAIIIVFFRRIKGMFLQYPALLMQVFLATLPLFPLLLLITPIKTAYASPAYLGFFFLGTAAILFTGVRFGKISSENNLRRNWWRDALLIGTWQAAAILPGISRSGSTISGARLLGWSPSEAITFSFLLAIPAILGGTVLELWHLLRHPGTIADLPLYCYFCGFILSFCIGWAALGLLMRAAVHNKFMYFAWYCLALGLATTYYFHL